MADFLFWLDVIKDKIQRKHKREAGRSRGDFQRCSPIVLRLTKKSGCVAGKGFGTGIVWQNSTLKMEVIVIERLAPHDAACSVPEDGEGIPMPADRIENRMSC